MMNRDRIQSVLTHATAGPVSEFSVLVRACELAAYGDPTTVGNPTLRERTEFAREVAEIAHEEICLIRQYGDIPSREY